jgi:acyl-CoA dehydrogenase
MQPILESYRPLWMTDEHQMLADTARRFAAEEVVPNDERWRRQHRVDKEAWKKAGALGLLCTDVPEIYGGMGGDFGHDAVIYRELSRACEIGFCAGRAVHAIVAHYILSSGTEAQKHRWLPGMATGETIGAIAMTEPGAGSDLKGIRTRAERRGDTYVINGSKTYISNALNMGVLVVVAKTDPGAGSKGISLILMEPHATPGFSVGRVLDKMGMPSQDTCELSFQDCEVPAENVLGGVEGRGMYQLMDQLPYERAILGHIASCFMERTLELTIDYTKDREAFGQAIFDFQHSRFTLAEIATKVTVARVFSDYVIGRRLAGTLDSATASMSKYWNTDTYGEVIDSCLQLFGGAGYMNEYPIARMYVDARALRIVGGSNEIMKELIARSLENSR